MSNYYLKGLATLLIAGFLSSCSQDGTVEPTNSQVVEQPTTVAELTDLLREYNASISDVTRSDIAAGTVTPRLSSNNTMGIVMADVEGCIRGAKHGGWLGGLAGAVVFSGFKAITNWLFPSSQTVDINIYPKGNSCTPIDSIGFYHNVVECELFNTSSRTSNSVALLNQADSIMKCKSLGYAVSGGLTGQQISSIAADVDSFKNYDTNNLSFDDYCGMLKQQNPEDGDYIDFVAEYLYIVFYANVDIDDYTGQVMFIVNNSNADVEDSDMLNKCIQVAYASTKLTTNMVSGN